MIMVQRWDYFAATEEFEPFDRGEWVKYEDYAALLSSVETLHDMVKLGRMQVEHISGFLEGILLMVKE